MLVRYINEAGFAISERELNVTNAQNVGDGWQTITKLHTNQNVPPPPVNIPTGAVAMEILRITGGYVYFATAANPAILANVIVPPPVGSTVLFPGEIIGQASPARPLNAVQGNNGILARLINQIFTTNVAASTGTAYSQNNTAIVQIFPNKFQRLLFDLSFVPAQATSTTVTISVQFELVDYDVNTPYADNRSSEKSALAQVFSQAFTSTSQFRETVEFPLPNPGTYKVTVTMSNTNTLTGTTGSPTSFIQVFHEVWS